MRYSIIRVCRSCLRSFGRLIVPRINAMRVASALNQCIRRQHFRRVRKRRSSNDIALRSSYTFPISLSLSFYHSFSCLVWCVFHALFLYYSLSIVPSTVQSSQGTAHQRNKNCFGSYAVQYHLGVRSTDNAISTFIHVHVPACTAARACPRLYSISCSSFLFIVTSENAYWMHGSADGAREAKCAWVQRLAPSKELATHQAQQ